MTSIPTHVVYVFREGALPSRFTCQEESLVVVYNRIMACFGPFGTKNVLWNERSKIKDSDGTFKIEVVRWQWLSESPWRIYIGRLPIDSTVSCQFLAKTFVKHEFHVALEERRERDMEKQKGTWAVVAAAVGLREDIHGA